jgi:hypothetical protein
MNNIKNTVKKIQIFGKKRNQRINLKMNKKQKLEFNL